jgi:hypothetical protein
MLGKTKVSDEDTVQLTLLLIYARDDLLAYLLYHAQRSLQRLSISAQQCYLPRLEGHCISESAFISLPMLLPTDLLLTFIPT